MAAGGFVAFSSYLALWTLLPLILWRDTHTALWWLNQSQNINVSGSFLIHCLSMQFLWKHSINLPNVLIAVYLSAVEIVYKCIDSFYISLILRVDTKHFSNLVSHKDSLSIHYLHVWFKFFMYLYKCFAYRYCYVSEQCLL